MTLKDTLAALKKAGTDQNRKIYTNHGAVLPLFGVSYAEQGKLKRMIGTDQKLALGLWKSGNHDARILACMIADAAAMKSNELDSWARDLGDYIICDAFCKLAARTPYAAKKSATWRDRKSEFVAAAGWELTGLQAWDQNSEMTSSEAAQLIKQITDEIHSRPNRTKHSMNQTLICLGVRSPQLHKKAMAAAKKIGKVFVDHGQTSCKTPDAILYMTKTLEHRAKKVGSQKGPR